MVIDRRNFLAGAGAAVMAGPMDHPHARPAKQTMLVGGVCRSSDGRYKIALVDPYGRAVTSVPLPGRGHDLAVSPTKDICVAFARRPGTFAVAFSPRKDSPAFTFTPSDGRHFYGHGVFSTDGRLLFATENNFETGTGVIGVYDATHSFARVGEFPTFGTGPHDLALLSDGVTLAVANGGYREHPAVGDGRTILNPETYQSDVCLIDSRHGSLIERYEIRTRERVSFRHLAIADGNRIVVGAQGLRTTADTDLVFIVSRGEEPRSLSMPVQAIPLLAGYVSSVAVSGDGKTAAVTSSRSNLVVLFDAIRGTLLKTSPARDVSGVTDLEGGNRFVVSTGFGVLSELGSDTEPRTIALDPTSSWDNHLTSF